MRKLDDNVYLVLRIFFKCYIVVRCYLFKPYCSNLYCAPMLFDCTRAALKSLKLHTTTACEDLCFYYSVIVPPRCL